MFTATIARFVCVLIVLLALSELGTCLDCYVCTTVDNKNCATPNSNTPTVQCFGSQNSCQKAVNSMGISRNCGLSQSCSSAVGCYSCTSNLCNSSSNIVPSFIVISIMGFVAIKQFLS